MVRDADEPNARGPRDYLRAHPMDYRRGFER
jgi:hypothetical protein